MGDPTPHAETTNPDRPVGTGPGSALERGTPMRDLLPAIEPGRRVDDWGRSERVEDAFDATVVEFLYRYWFRCEAEGIENVPGDGAALLVANHAGALPPDGAMIAKAIRDSHPHPRPLSIGVDHPFKGYPGASMLLAKIGWVPAHPANVHRLLADERRLVLTFPEGREGPQKPYRERYRLQRFGNSGFVEAAMRARARLVPTCVIGAEEAAPAFGRSELMRRLTRLPDFPLTPTFPWLGPAGMLTYLPAKFKIRFLEPIDTSRMGDDPSSDASLVQTVAGEVRARIQENLREMVAKRRSVWLG